MRDCPGYLIELDNLTQLYSIQLYLKLSSIPLHPGLFFRIPKSSIIRLATAVGIQTFCRYTKFFKLFRTKLTRLFESYEEQEGEYHGNESAPATVSGRDKRGCRRELTMADVEAMSDDTDDFMDHEFV